LQAKPFTVEMSDEVVDDLRARLARTRWPEPLPGPGWAYGVELELLPGRPTATAIGMA
jgi:hypothetical protein